MHRRACNKLKESLGATEKKGGESLASRHMTLKTTLVVRVRLLGSLIQEFGF